MHCQCFGVGGSCSEKDGHYHDRGGHYWLRHYYWRRGHFNCHRHCHQYCHRHCHQHCHRHCHGQEENNGHQSGASSMVDGISLIRSLLPFVPIETKWCFLGFIDRGRWGWFGDFFDMFDGDDFCTQLLTLGALKGDRFYGSGGLNREIQFKAS